MEAAAGREVKGKVKYLQGAFRRSYSPLADQIFHAPGAKPWHYAADLHTLSVLYPLCGSALTDTTNNPSEMCPPRLTDFCLFLYHQLYTILKGLHIPTIAFTSCKDWGSNLLPKDGRAGTLTTQPSQLAY